jgi:hypothetical protein
LYALRSDSDTSIRKIPLQMTRITAWQKVWELTDQERRQSNIMVE